MGPALLGFGILVQMVLAGAVFIIDPDSLIPPPSTTNQPPSPLFSGALLLYLLPVIAGALWIAWGRPLFESADHSVPFKTVPHRAFRRVRLGIWLPSCFVVTYLLLVPASDQIHWRSQWGQWDEVGLREALPLYATMFAAGLVFSLFAPRVARHVRSRMVGKARALQICYACGYDMRGKPDGPCPECGYDGGHSTG